jgi:hypothetical protein
MTRTRRFIFGPLLALAALAVVPALSARASARADQPEASGQAKAVIEGRVLDRETKDPLPAYVMIAGGGGVSAGSDGRFRLTVAAVPEAGVRLVVYLLGYQKKEILAKPGSPVVVELDLEPLPAKEVTVSADSIVSDGTSPRTVSLGKMDVYRVPGAAADPLYASHVLPGVNSLPDSSGLLIRGGAPREVGYYFDGIEISHPFLSESLHESYFSVFDNQIIDGFSVSTSGVHPRYGDLLSGVMALTAKDAAPRTELNLGLSVLGLTSYMGLPVGEGGGFIGSYNRGWSDVLTWLNGREGQAFRTAQGFGKLILPLGASHKLRIYGFRDDYRFTQSEAFNASSENAMAGLTWTAAWGSKITTRAVAAWTDYRSIYDELGAFRAESGDRAFQLRADASWDLERHYLEFGGDVVRRRVRQGLPTIPDADWTMDGTRTGFFVNDRFRVAPKIFVTAGARLAHLDANGSRTAVDPRFSLAYLAAKSDTIRLSAGQYHQFGDFASLARTPGLAPPSAIHAALSFDRVRETLEVRATVYDKEYRGLFLSGPAGETTNGGRGYARGAELFFKSKGSAWDFIAVYNYLSSRRLEGEVGELAPSPYEIRHAGTLIVSRKFKGGSLSARISAASGRPVTPLLGREWDAAEAAYDPVWGAPMSARYPGYSRIDLSGSQMVTIGKTAAIFYYGLTNVLDTANISSYDYGADYAERKDQRSIFGRTIFLGVYILL